MIEILRLSAFLIFIGLGLAVRFTSAARRRRAVNAFIIYTLALSFFVATTQTDAWPFSTYRLAVESWKGQSTRVWQQWAFYGVDGSGAEWEIDPYSWSPLFPVAIQSWMTKNYAELDNEEKDRLGQFFLERAEDSRARLASGEDIGARRRLGWLAYPAWYVVRRPDSISSEPYVRLRIYLRSWRPADWMTDRKSAHELVWESER